MGLANSVNACNTRGTHPKRVLSTSSPNWLRHHADLSRLSSSTYKITLANHAILNARITPTYNLSTLSSDAVKSNLADIHRTTAPSIQSNAAHTSGRTARASANQAHVTDRAVIEARFTFCQSWSLADSSDAFSSLFADPERISTAALAKFARHNTAFPHAVSGALETERANDSVFQA